MRRHWPYCAVLAASAAVYAGFFTSFFPNPSGRLGGDYSYFLPLLLAGRYWIAANGLLSAPDFSPAFCGGLPFLANPQSIFYSVPQVLDGFIDPQTSFLLTGILFAWLGGGGTFLLLFARFGTSMAAAALGAIIFLFNGFILYKSVFGDVTYHTVGLLPLLCYALLTPVAEGPARYRRFIAATASGGAILTYFIYAGAPNIVVPAGLSVIAVWLLHAGVRRPVLTFWPAGLLAGVLAAVAGAAKLAPGFVFLAPFPRAELWIFPDFVSASSALFRGLFAPWMLPVWEGKIETEFGLGPVPVILLLCGLCAAIARGNWRRRPMPHNCLALTALVVVLAIPLWLSYGGPDFAARLQALPYIGEFRMLTRWYFIYLLPVTASAALMLDFVFARPRMRDIAALIGAVATILPAVLVDTSYYRDQQYDPAPILAADRVLRATGTAPPIVAIAPSGRHSPNDGLASGASSFPCYEPLFGFNLQSFPWGLRFGPLSAAGHHLRNPACYIYGGANGCAPGDEFTPRQAAAEAAFAAYRPFPYRRPSWQRAADLASLIGLATILAGLAVGVLGWRRRTARLERRQPA